MYISIDTGKEENCKSEKKQWTINGFNSRVIEEGDICRYLSIYELIGMDSILARQAMLKL